MQKKVNYAVISVIVKDNLLLAIFFILLIFNCI